MVLELLSFALIQAGEVCSSTNALSEATKILQLEEAKKRKPGDYLVRVDGLANLDGWRVLLRIQSKENPEDFWSTTLYLNKRSPMGVMVSAIRPKESMVDFVLDGGTKVSIKNNASSTETMKLNFGSSYDATAVPKDEPKGSPEVLAAVEALKDPAEKKRIEDLRESFVGMERLGLKDEELYVVSEIAMKLLREDWQKTSDEDKKALGLDAERMHARALMDAYIFAIEEKKIIPEKKLAHRLRLIPVVPEPPQLRLDEGVSSDVEHSSKFSEMSLEDLLEIEAPPSNIPQP